MSQGTLHSRLTRLHQLILRERECAKALDLEAMREATREKEELIESLEPAGESDPELHRLAEEIRSENRRNAYLLWAGLRWVRESMSFFREQTESSAYAAGGALLRGREGGRLLSGRV